jgi:hypothetical protein
MQVFQKIFAQSATDSVLFTNFAAKWPLHIMQQHKSGRLKRENKPF